jgi:hypothetical protein
MLQCNFSVSVHAKTKTKGSETEQEQHRIAPPAPILDAASCRSGYPALVKILTPASPWSPRQE